MPIDFVGVNQQIMDIGSKMRCVLIDVGYVFGITSFSNSSTLRLAQYEWARTGQSHRSRVRCPSYVPNPTTREEHTLGVALPKIVTPLVVICYAIPQESDQ